MRYEIIKQSPDGDVIIHKTGIGVDIAKYIYASFPDFTMTGVDVPIKEMTILGILLSIHAHDTFELYTEDSHDVFHFTLETDYLG